MAAVPAASCIGTEHGCVMFDCLVHLWEWIDPPVPESTFAMDNKNNLPATQQPLTQQQVVAHHVHPSEQIYVHQHPQLTAQLTSPQSQLQPNGVMHQLLQSQYQSNLDARSPLLENRHELYGTGHAHDYAKHYGTNDNYNYAQSPQRSDVQSDHNVNHELLQNIPKGYNAEVYQDYLKRNPPKDTNQMYQNHQLMYRSNVNQYGSKPYLPYSSRIGPQSNTELLRRQYNEIQQMKLQQQLHYQNQAQMQQQQTFAERQMLLQQIHGIQPPPNLQNSIYSDGSYRDLDPYGSRNDFKEQFSSPDIQKDVDRFIKNNEFKEVEKQSRQYQESQYQCNQQLDYRETDRYRNKQLENENNKCQSSPSDDSNQGNQRGNCGIISPMKSSESSSPSVKSPSSESRRSSGGHQALRSPVAQRIPSAPVTVSGILYKQGSDGLKVWRKRWFVLSEYCLFYYKSQDEEKLLGSVLLPSYRVSACTAEDRVMRKYAFKLEHTNMRTYILAAPDQEAMMVWVKALTMAALMQSPSEQSIKNERTAAKPAEDEDEVPGPTYANAPPKPRRSNEGYNSPSPEMYDPNYDLLKKPASHYSQGTNYTRYHDHTTYQTSPNTEQMYTRNPQSPSQTSLQQQPMQTKRPYDTHNLSLPLTNTITDRLENNPQSNTSLYGTNVQPLYFDNRTRTQHQQARIRDIKTQEQIYDQSNAQRNPFLQDTTPVTEISPKDCNSQNRNFKSPISGTSHQDETANDIRYNTSNMDTNTYNRDSYGELNMRQMRPSNVSINDRLIERRTPDAYGRSSTGLVQNKPKVGDYEDVYSIYATENEYGRPYSKPVSPQTRENTTNYNQIQSFSGPAILRRKKMQSSGIQPPVPRPHSADFLEYESRNEMLNRTMPTRSTPSESSRQPQRPKSSLDINSYYDPSSDRYYSEESYAEKMRQSAQYLPRDRLEPKNIQIPLEKYASGLAEKQLHSPYSQSTNNNYETEFSLNKKSKENIIYNSKYIDNEGIHSNWTLKEKENQKEYLNRSGSVMSDSSNITAFIKEGNKYDSTIPDGFMRSASARLPSTTTERDGEKKVQQREESMKRLLEWKQRMLQSPLTRKSTPASISLARSLNQSRSSVRSTDQYKTKTYTNASYNSYSSDDEEQTTGTDLPKTTTMQAGRFQRENLPSLNTTQIQDPHEPPLSIPVYSKIVEDINENLGCDKNISHSTLLVNEYENMEIRTSKLGDNAAGDNFDSYENTFVTEQTAVENKNSQIEQYENENSDSEAESETQMEYTDDDLDEVLLHSDEENVNQENGDKMKENRNGADRSLDIENNNSETPPLKISEDHYLPMSPRKISNVEPAHKTIIKSLSVFDQTLSHGVEDNPYVEMNIGSEVDDLQNYEIVCVNNGKVEPVYMELNNICNENEYTDESSTLSQKLMIDTASNFADTKEQTLKRASKGEKGFKVNERGTVKSIGIFSSSKLDSSDADDEASKDMSLDTPFNRFSISDTFRPASYYLSGSTNILDTQDSSDSEILSSPPIRSLSPPCDELSGEALSKYVLDKLDKSNLSQDNSILKMLTNENQKMNTVKRKTTSLMIYGSRTSIHDTLTRGEKIRNSRASLSNDKSKITDIPTNLISNSVLEHYTSHRSIETDSLISYNADRGSSRSLESDVSSKFEMGVSNISSEVTSLNDSDTAIELRHLSNYRDIEIMNKRRPLSEDSFFELDSCENNNCELSNIDLDRYLNNLQTNNESAQPVLNKPLCEESHCDRINYMTTGHLQCKNNVARAAKLQSSMHTRCSSTPVAHTSKATVSSNITGEGAFGIQEHDQQSGYTGSQSSCSSVGITKSPISYYCKNYDEETIISKNLNNEILSDKIKEFECEKISLKNGNETNVPSITTGFHSRESSNEHSAPYYYSDLSSQEHLNIMPISHYLKNTNLHRKLNNQRRRVLLNKKNDISHIHNPIHSSFLNESFELVGAARSVSVEFLCAADKDPEIDVKNIYESTGGKKSKIPESMTNLMSTVGCKSHTNINYGNQLTELSSNSKLSSISTIQVSERGPTASTSAGHVQNSINVLYRTGESNGAYENLICQGDKLWDEDSLWRDNLRRVSHRHAKSLDDLDTLPPEPTSSNHSTKTACGMNSLKHVKKESGRKVSRNVTYVNSDIQSQLMTRLEISSFHDDIIAVDEKVGEDDVYVSLATNNDVRQEQCDEGVYEQLALETVDLPLVSQCVSDKDVDYQRKFKNKFEIDREKLRQWDLMSSGLMKGGMGVVRGDGAGICVGAGEAHCSTDSGADSASNEASMTMPGSHLDAGANNLSSQQALSKKAFLGSNTSITRTNRDANIPVRAVSPRVRWVEDKTPNDICGSQQITASQQNINTLAMEDAWVRSPSRTSQQPIRAVSPRVRRNMENDDLSGKVSALRSSGQQLDITGEIPSAGELLGRTHEELVLLLIQLRRRHAATHRAMEQCCVQINSIENCLGSLKAMEREESLQRLDQLKMQLMELEHQYQKSKPLVQLVDNMVKLGSLYNRPGSTMERLERNQRLRQKVLAEHALEQQRWLESAAAGRPLETEAARARVAELWALEQELADEAAILQGMKTDKDAIESLLTGVRTKFNTMHGESTNGEHSLEAELARVHAMLALNSKKLEQTVADNARLERELMQLRRALQNQRQSPAPSHAPAAATALLEDEVSRVQQLVSALQRQRQELSRAVRHLTQQSRVLQTTQHAMPGSKQRRGVNSSWQETNLDTGHTTEHGQSEYSDYDVNTPVMPPGHYDQRHLNTPLYVDINESVGGDMGVMSPMTSEEMQNSAIGNLSNVEKQEIKTVRIVKRESERRQRDRERSLQPMSDWSTNNVTANLDQFLEEEMLPSANNYSRSASLPRTDFSKFEEYYSKPHTNELQTYSRAPKEMTTSIEHSPKYPSSPSLSNYDFSREISSLNSSYNKSYDHSSYDRTISISTQYLNSPTDSCRTLTNDPISKTSSIGSLARSHAELSPIFKSEAAKQIITEMSSDNIKNGSLHRRQVPKEKRRHYTAPHHLSAKTLNEMPNDMYNQDKMGRSLDDADMERALRAPPDVVRSAIAPQRFAENTIDQLLAAPQKILIPERYIPEKSPELSPEEQQKRQEKVESIKKMLSSSSADPSKTPDGEENRQRQHLLQMNQILAKQVMEMSKIVAVKALEELPLNDKWNDPDDRSPDVELPIYQQRDNFFT